MGKLGKCWEKIGKNGKTFSLKQSVTKIVLDIFLYHDSTNHKYIILNIFSFSFAKAVITFDLHLDLHPLRMEMMICDFTSRILFRPRIYCCGLLIWFYYCYYLYLHRHTNSRFYMCVHCAHFVHKVFESAHIFQCAL